MNRLRTGLPVALAFATVAGAALAADEPPASPPPAPTASTATTGTAPAAAAQKAPASTTPAANKSEVRRMFCLNMAMQCFAAQQATADSAKTRLDLRAPDIKHFVSEAELREPIQDEYEVQQEQEQVQVEGSRPEIYVPGGLVSLPWAVMHPTQAWRIFLPVPPSAAK